MSKRAKVLAKYLENELGWSVYNYERTCSCGHREYDDQAKFCNRCGKRLKKTRTHSTAEEELEEAIKHMEEHS